MKVPEYSDLEKMYDNFVDQVDLKEISDNDDKGYRCHSIFLNEFIGTPSPCQLFQVRKRITVKVNVKAFDINYENAPNFFQKEHYLEWLFKQIKD